MKIPRKEMLRAALVLIFIVFTAGCAINKSPYSTASELITNSDRAPIFVFWRAHSSQRLHIYPIPAEIFVDDVSVGKISLDGHTLLALKPGIRNISIIIHKDYPLPPLFPFKDLKEKMPVELGKEGALIFEWVRATQYSSGTIKYLKSRTIPDDLKKSGRNFMYVEP